MTRVVACAPTTACSTGTDAVLTPVLISEPTVTVPAPRALAPDKCAPYAAASVTLTAAAPASAATTTTSVAVPSTTNTVAVAWKHGTGESNDTGGDDGITFQLYWTLDDVRRTLPNYKPTGLLNHGNTCFLNAALQVETKQLQHVHTSVVVYL